MRARLLVLVLAAAFLAQGIVVGWQLKQVHDARAAGRVQSCLAISKLDDTLIELIRASEKSLPSLQYYREHPDDLVKVLNQDEQAITALTPPKFC